MRDNPRFQIGEWWIDQPHPEHGGIWYRCRYDARTRTRRCRSLKTADEEAAKIALATFVATVPQTSREGPPSADKVMTLAVLDAYMDGHGATIASEDVAARAVELFGDYLAHIKQITAPVAFWTESQQIKCAKWLHGEHDHAAGYIERLFNVMRSSLLDACKVKLRADGFGNEIETALIASAPKIVMTAQRASEELKIPLRSPRQPTPTIEQMATLLDTIESEHLFRFAILSLCTWARPRAVIDFDPQTQAHWNDGTIDLAPLGWVPTKKRRPRQPMSLCLAGWLSRWTQEEAARRAADERAGHMPLPPGLLIYKRARVGSVKRGFQLLADDLGLPFSQKGFRHFMADQVKKNFRLIAGEQRSRWLGHKVRDGSDTTRIYESDDPHDIVDVALATDCIISLVNERCARDLFAIDVRLTRAELQAIGARRLPKTVVTKGKNGGRDRDRTCDPYHVKVVRLADFRAKPAKRRA